LEKSNTLAPAFQSQPPFSACFNFAHEGEIEYFDFTLPDEVTDYVISVHFDDAGTIEGISMES
jgi:hypothetical protein